MLLFSPMSSLEFCFHFFLPTYYRIQFFKDFFSSKKFQIHIWISKPTRSGSLLQRRGCSFSHSSQRWYEFSGQRICGLSNGCQSWLVMKSGVTIFRVWFLFWKTIGFWGSDLYYRYWVGLYSHKDLGFLGTYPISSL